MRSTVNTGLLRFLFACSIGFTCDPARASQAERPYAAWYQYQADFLVRNAAKRGWTISATGLQAKRVSEATHGRKPADKDTVKVHYVGKSIGGIVFDSSIERGEPAAFPLNEVIDGWREGVAMMSVGETWEFVLPAHFAYGEKGVGEDIPPGSTLLFTIELLSIEIP